MQKYYYGILKKNSSPSLLQNLGGHVIFEILFVRTDIQF